MTPQAITSLMTNCQDSLSFDAFMMAVDMAEDMQKRIDANKGACAIYDGELIEHPAFEVVIDDNKSKVMLTDKKASGKTHFKYVIAGDMSVDEKIYVRKKHVRQMFSEIKILAQL